MKTIEYRATYNGTLTDPPYVDDDPWTEIVRVTARDINAGFSKALAKTREPLGNGKRRELARLEFSQVVS